jgi:putative 4-mercaptohistidine N1-methyltranferase
MSSATSRVDSISNSVATQANPYESERLLCEYLLFHYGEPGEILPYEGGPVSALGYAQRCVRECLDVSLLGANSRGLDLGCAVGRSSFELARDCSEVVGIDYSQLFIEAAERVRTVGKVPYWRADEGDLRTSLVACRPKDVDLQRVSFEQGDAMALRQGLGVFDVVLMANLIDRLREPLKCLERLPSLVVKGGQLIVTSPYTWLPDYTERSLWLGGFSKSGVPQTTLEGLRHALDADFELVATRDLPFLIREHARKYQWSVAQASIWRRR